MKHDIIPEWETPFLDALIDAEEIAIRSYTHLIINMLITVDVPTSSSIGQAEFERNEVEMIRTALIQKWEIKRQYYIKLCEYGLMVYVQVSDSYGRQSVQALPFSTYVRMVDKNEYETEKIKWFPSQFTTVEHFEQFRTAKLIEAGLLDNELVAA
jgi:hypothetical protein